LARPIENNTESGGKVNGMRRPVKCKRRWMAQYRTKTNLNSASNIAFFIGQSANK
jgi:hypothetical protein